MPDYLSTELAPSVAYVDTETTGLDPLRHAVWEVAIVIPGHRAWTTNSFQIELTPTELRQLDPEAAEINRFHDRYRAERAIGKRHAAVLIEQLLQGRHIVGSSPSFDEERIRRLCDAALRDGRPPEQRPWHHHLIDVGSLMLGWLAARGTPVSPPWKSDDLSRRCGVEPPVLYAERHSAVADAHWVGRIYERITRGG